MAKTKSAAPPDWSTLTHARGPAIHVAGDLELLTSASPQKRAAGLDELNETLYSKGSHYSAGAAAVPLLLDLALDPSTPDRHAILALVADVLAGNHTTRLTTGIDLGDEATQKTYGRGDAKKIVTAVTERLGALTTLLSDGDAPVRAATALLLAFTPTAVEATPAIVEQIAAEQDVGAKTAAILCLGYLARYGADAAKDALQRLSDDQVPETRGAATLALLLDRRAPSALSADKLAGYFLIGDLPAVACPFNQGQLIRLGTAICAAAGDRARTAAEDALVKCVVDARGDAQHKLDESTGWVPVLLELEFPRRNDFPMADAFSARQREMLSAISRFPLSQVAFFRRGIPSNAETRRRWLGIDPPGPLERVIPLGAPDARPTWPLWRSMLAFQDARVDEAVVDGKLREHLAPTDLAELHGEWSLRFYGLGEPDILLTLAAFADAGPMAVPIARAFLDTALQSEPEMRDANGNRALSWGVGASNVALKTILDAMPTGSRVLAPEYDPMVQILPDDTTHEILMAIPMDRREKLLTAVLERPGTPVVFVIARHLDLVPTPTFIVRILDAIDQADDDYARDEHRGYVLEPFQLIAETHPEIKRLLDERGFSLS